MKKKSVSCSFSHFPFWLFVLVVSTFFFIAQQEDSSLNQQLRNKVKSRPVNDEKSDTTQTINKSSKDRNNLIVPFSPIIRTGPVNDLLVDSSGVLWIAAEDGVYSYANGNLSYFSQENGKFIAPQAECLAFDGQKIWVGSFFGLFSISKTGRLQSHQISDNPGDEIIWDLLYDGITIWAGTQNGIRFIDKEGDFVKIDTMVSNGGLRHNWCYRIARFSGWFVTGHDKGLSFWNTGFKASDPSYWKNVDASRSGLTRPITGITSDGQNLWVSTANGIFFLSTPTDKLFSGSISNFIKYSTVHGLPSNRVNAIISHKNVVWAGTDLGLARISEEQIQTISPTDARTSANVTALCASGDILWLGTDKGIQFINTAMVD